jgi:Flp pilus assembly protein TadG
MKKKLHPVQERCNQKGAVLVLVAVLLIVFVGMAAMALDVGHLYLVRNELQNAADSGALAGARELYLDTNASTVNAGANQIAFDTAILNKSEKVAVEVNDPLTNSGDVQRGHWSFANRTFTPNSSTEPYDLSGKSDTELDADTNFVNAVKVKVRREEVPAASFFARIFGYDDFALTAQAIAYRGFAGSLPPGSLDQPIAICEQYVKDADGNYSCNVGRMISNNNETGGWVNFNQEPGCGSANPPDISQYFCGGNTQEIFFGKEIGTNNGMTNLVDTFYNSDCWSNKGNQIPTKPLNATLPVVDCKTGDFSQTCVEKVVAAVNVDIIWVNNKDANEDFNMNAKVQPPKQMDAPGYPPFTCDYTDSAGAKACWEEFADHFDLKDQDGNPGNWLKQTIYFLPTCQIHDPVGFPGGPNFGVLSKYPVLVD